MKRLGCCDQKFNINKWNIGNEDDSNEEVVSYSECNNINLQGYFAIDEYQKLKQNLSRCCRTPNCSWPNHTSH